MAMTHEQIDEQMVDFLYGELPAGARAAFEAHVAGCDRCRREVESFGQVRAVARTVLDEAPPGRVHEAILRAAREAVVAPAKKAKKEAKKVEPARASLWNWLRGRWAFPTLATVGALSVFILGSRLFLNPNTVRQLSHPAPISEPAASTPAANELAPATGAPRAVEVPEPATAPAPGDSPASVDSPARATHVRRKLGAEAKAARSETARSGAASLKNDSADGMPGSGAGAREKSSKRDDLLGGIGGPPRDKAPAGGAAGYARPPAPGAEKPQANADFGSGGGGRSKKKVVSAVLEDDRAQVKEEAAPGESRAEKSRGYAQPPPPAAAPSPAPRYAEPPPSKAAAAEPDSYAADDSPELARAAPRPAAKAQSRVSRGAGAAPAPVAAPSAPAPAPVAASRARARADEAESGTLADKQTARETLAQRADRLFTQGRWAEAAVAYRDLLRQQPNSPDVERWRRRLAAARAAVATGRPPPSSR